MSGATATEAMLEAGFSVVSRHYVTDEGVLRSCHYLSEASYASVLKDGAPAEWTDKVGLDCVGLLFHNDCQDRDARVIYVDHSPISYKGMDAAQIAERATEDLNLRVNKLNKAVSMFWGDKLSRASVASVLCRMGSIQSDIETIATMRVNINRVATYSHLCLLPPS